MPSRRLGRLVSGWVAIVAPPAPVAILPNRLVVSRRAPRRRVRLVADLGLALLPILATEILTGLVLFVFAYGLMPKGAPWAQAVFDWLAAANLLFLQDVPFQTDVHVWVGYLTCWVVALKIWASWPTLLNWSPRRFSLPRVAAEKLAAVALLVLAAASYLTGLALAVRLPWFHDRTLRDVHLVVSALLLVPLAWHLVRFLATSLRVVSVQVKRFGHRRRRSAPREDAVTG